MLSGVKFIPRDQLKSGSDLPITEKKGGLHNTSKISKKRKGKKLEDDSSDEDSMITIKKKSKKWSSSDDDYTSSGSSEDSEKEEEEKQGCRRKAKDLKEIDARSSRSKDEKELARKEAGLDWMTKPRNSEASFPIKIGEKLEEPVIDEVKMSNPRELNPYFKDNNTGYPEDTDGTKSEVTKVPLSVVGDGGASWRRKALKRAQEQAAREGKKLDEVVGERWGSLGQLAVSAASHAAPAHAHLHAIRDRKRSVTEKQDSLLGDHNNQNMDNAGREYLKDVSIRHPDMKAPRVRDSLSWRKRNDQYMRAKDAQVLSVAGSFLNKFENDGSFLDQTKVPDESSSKILSSTDDVIEVSKESEQIPSATQLLSVNQLAAKAMQLRMKGKNEEAAKLLKEVEIMKMKQETESKLAIRRTTQTTSRYIMEDASAQQKKKEEDADMHLARKIAQNKQYSMSGRADDEYDIEFAPSKKQRQKSKGAPEQLNRKNTVAKRVVTQQDRCQFCFENPTRPRHLVISIANFTYLMTPQWQPIVQGHCCIVPMQHEASSRKVDNGVWEEMRNFKKCLIKMFAEQEKEVVFLETVIGLAQQRRHCLIECIPLPRELARQGPLYFKKAIDEAEGEWSQHNAKKLIDTSQKGLRGSIPENFPYFHVEFGLGKGFVHIIDDETKFESSFGLNIIRGMLRLPEEDMHRRRRPESVETQKQAVLGFAKEWDSFDWTKQLS